MKDEYDAITDKEAREQEQWDALTGTDDERLAQLAQAQARREEMRGDAMRLKYDL